MCIAQRVASVNFFPPPTYWRLLKAVSIETSGVVEFGGIRFDFATKGLIGLTGRRRRVLSSRRVRGGAVSQSLVEGPRMTDPGLWLRFQEMMSQVGLPGLPRMGRREGGLMMVEAVEVQYNCGSVGLSMRLWEHGRDAYLAGKKGGGLADRRCQEHAGTGPIWPLF